MTTKKKTTATVTRHDKRPPHYINEFNLEPGTYQHYKGGLYVVVEIVSHMEDPATNQMERLQDPLVVYRDLIQPVTEHVKGKPVAIHKRYARTLSDFIAKIDDGGKRVQRFVKV